MKYMEYGEYKETLQEMIHQLLKGGLSLPKFKSEFSRFYLEEVPSEILSDNEWLFYSTILESLDCIFAIPDLLCQQLGWRGDSRWDDLTV